MSSTYSDALKELEALEDASENGEPTIGDYVRQDRRFDEMMIASEEAARDPEMRSAAMQKLMSAIKSNALRHYQEELDRRFEAMTERISNFNEFYGELHPDYMTPYWQGARIQTPFTFSGAKSVDEVDPWASTYLNIRQALTDLPSYLTRRRKDQNNGAAICLALRKRHGRLVALAVERKTEILDMEPIKFQKPPKTLEEAAGFTAKIYGIVIPDLVDTLETALDIFDTITINS